MCWNQYVSINTFFFSTVILLLIIYNNVYSPYKITEFNNNYVYLFIFSVISMQLIEFFLWRNLKNKDINVLFSKLGATLLILQPVASLMLLSDISLRINALIAYCVPAFSYLIYKLYNKDFITFVSKNNHLTWDWLWLKLENTNLLLFSYWLFFLLFSLFINKQYIFIFVGLSTLLISFYNSINDNSIGSVWCWAINVVMLFFAFKLLLWLPFKEHGIC